jgi:parvulin-like peptidyl-prolyl isomerase
VFRLPAAHFGNESTPRRASTLLRAMAGCVLLLASFGCDRGCERSKRAAERSGPRVATIGTLSVSAADIERHLAGESEAARRLYQDKSARKELVDGVIRFELLASEAERRGYANDPDVIRGMKQQMIARMLQDEAAKQADETISAEEITHYFEEHHGEFHKPAAASVREIVTKDRATADALANEARSSRRPDYFADQKAFKKLASRHLSEPGKPGGQESVFFEEQSSPFPKEVTQAIFAMTELGEVTGPIESAQGYHVVKLAGRRPEVTRAVDQVREQIRQQLVMARRKQRTDSFIAELRKRTPIQIDEAALDQVSWSPSSTTLRSRSRAVP